ncbi:MAG: sulfatase, partial [Chryseolinea sp.]
MPHTHDDEFRIKTPEFDSMNRRLDRRQFLLKTSLGLGALATGSLLGGKALFGKSAPVPPALDASSQEA